MDEIWDEFKQESFGLLIEMTRALEAVEKDLSRVDELEHYGNLVDRIMGGAKNLAVSVNDKDHPIYSIATYTEICKLIAYKSSQINENTEFIKIAVAFLFDATEMIEEMLTNVKQSQKYDQMKGIQDNMLDRLKWISQYFSEDLRGSVALDKKGDQQELEGPDDLEKLLEQLGVSGKVS